MSHLGGDEHTTVDRDREFFPCGQGVGAIHELRPAAELVQEFVAEAEKVIDRLSSPVIRAPAESPEQRRLEARLHRVDEAGGARIAREVHLHLVHHVAERDAAVGVAEAD